MPDEEGKVEETGFEEENGNDFPFTVNRKRRYALSGMGLNDKIPNLEDQASRRIHMGNCRPTEVQKPIRPNTIRREEWPKLSKKQKEEDIANWDERPDCKKLTEKEILRGLTLDDKDTPKVITEI